MRNEKQNANRTGTTLTVRMNIEKQFNRLTQGKIKRYSQEAIKWFSRYIPRSYNNVNTSTMFRDRNMWTKQMKVGKMYFFEYDAIHKDKLPIWDRYPVIWVVDMYKDKGHTYFTGLNVHYLPPALRCKLMIELLKLRNEKRYRESTRLQLTYDILKASTNNDMLKECYKCYRVDALRSVFVEIPSQSWSMAIFLPVARWVKKNKH